MVELLNSGKVNYDICRNSLLQIRNMRYQIANMSFSPSAGMTEKLIRSDLIQEYAEKIHELDPNFVVPTPQSNGSNSTNSSGGCYVATCVYGSYDCPQVWTLRRFRDNTLGSTWYGRAFIRTYYAISPTLVKWFGKTNWFKKMWRGTLDRMIKNLEENGVENTPYEDKDWR